MSSKTGLNKIRRLNQALEMVCGVWESHRTHQSIFLASGLDRKFSRWSIQLWQMCDQCVTKNLVTYWSHICHSRIFLTKTSDRVRMQEIPIGGSDRPCTELSTVSGWPVYSSSSSGRLRRILVVGDENAVVFDLKVTRTVSKQHVEWAVSISVSQFSFRRFLFTSRYLLILFWPVLELILTVRRKSLDL